MIESWGYANTIVPGAVWARVHAWAAGKRYWVYDQDHLRVTPVNNGTREVSLSTGYGGGQGIVDHNPTPLTLQLPVVTSGTRYFMVGLRREWGIVKATAFGYVAAGASGNILLPARPVDFGVGVDFQPLAMVPLAAGSAIPGTPIDLRVMGTEPGRQHALSELVLQYSDYLGAEIQIGGTTWSRVLNVGGTGHVWKRDPLVGSGSDVLTTFPGWTGADQVIKAKRQGSVVDLNFRVRRTGARIEAGAVTGHTADFNICTIKPDWRPAGRPSVRVPFFYDDFSAVGQLTEDGVLSLTSATPDRDIATNAVLLVTTTFMRD